MAKNLIEISQEVGKVEPKQVLADFRELQKENPNWMNTEEAKLLRSGQYDKLRQKQKMVKSWKAVQNLPPASEMMEAKSLNRTGDTTDSEDLIEEYIPFSELGK